MFAVLAGLLEPADGDEASQPMKATYRDFGNALPAGALAQLCKVWPPSISQLTLAIDPTLVRTRPAHIGVDLSGSYAFGATVADFWGERGEIAHEVDADRFFN